MCHWHTRETSRKRLAARLVNANTLVAVVVVVLTSDGDTRIEDNNNSGSLGLSLELGTFTSIASGRLESQISTDKHQLNNNNNSHEWKRSSFGRHCGGRQCRFQPVELLVNESPVVF